MPFDPISYTLARKKVSESDKVILKAVSVPPSVGEGYEMVFDTTNNVIRVYLPYLSEWGVVSVKVGYYDFDNNGGGTWPHYINIPVTTTPSEYAQYKVVIDSTNVTVYAADGTQKTQGAVAADFWSKIRTDGADIRVFDQARTQLYFWVEEFDYINKTATIWVKLEAGSSELNIAYGNSSATASTYNDPQQTFELFDDFKGTELDTSKWIIDAVNHIDYEVNNYFRFKDATKSSNTYWIYDNTDTGSQIQARWTPIESFIVEWRSIISDTSASQMGEGSIALVGSDNYISAYIAHIDPQGASLSPSVGYIFVEGSSASGFSVSNGDARDFRYVVHDNTVEIYQKAASESTYTLMLTGTSNDIAKLALAAGAYGGYPYLNYIQINYIRVMKYSDPGEFGSPQISQL